MTARSDALGFSEQPCICILIPLTPDGMGGFRVTGTRVALDVVLRDHQRGASPDGIVEHYPALNVRDVYLVIGWYLANKVEVDRHLEARQKWADTLRETIEAVQPGGELKAKLLARQKEDPPC